MKSLNHDFYDSMITMKSTKQKKITLQTKGKDV